MIKIIDPTSGKRILKINKIDNIVDLFFDQFAELTKDKRSKKSFIDNYYFPNDVHYNKEGNLLISNFLNKILMTNN